MFDFNGQASGAVLKPGLTTLQLGTEGFWAIYGLSACTCDSDQGGLNDGTNINIQILDVLKNDYFFNYSQDYALNGAPLEHVAGKWGNVHWLDYPKIMAPGTRMMLYGSQFSGDPCNGRSPLYVAVHAVLTREPVPNMSMGSGQSQITDASGEPFSFSTKFVFSGGTNSLAVGASRTQSSPLNGRTAFFIDSITLRGNDDDNIESLDWIHSVDPRRHEYEIMLGVRDSVAQSSFNQPDMVPLPLMVGLSGSREFVPPTYFEVNPGAEIVTTISNPSSLVGSLDEDMELTFAGSILKRSGIDSRGGR